MAKKRASNNRKTPRKRNPSSSATTQSTSDATVVNARIRPQYLVLFHEISEANVSTISKVLKVGNADAQANSRSSRTVLQAKATGGSSPCVYQRLGVAVADLDPDEVLKIQSEDRVLSVVKNQVRTIPKYFVQESRHDAESRNTPNFSDPLIPYLLGMREMADAVLRFRGIEIPDGERIDPIGGSEANLSGALASRWATHSWCLDMIGLSQNYNLATGSGVMAAVLDTGVDMDHPDFTDVFREGDNAKSFVPGESVQDGNGHGTHCAGVIGASAQSAGGRRYSVAPNVNLLAGKVLSDEGFGNDDQIIDGIDWAADMGATIISMSLGSSRSVDDPAAPQYELIASNLLNGSPGVLLVAAAGNDSQRPYFTCPVGNPAACQSIASVGAVDRGKRIASFSCKQMDGIGSVDFAAPGVSVYSSWTGGRYRTISGTSMAAPHVAGIAALYQEMNPQLSAIETWKMLSQSCLRLGDESDFGSGLVRVPSLVRDRSMHGVDTFAKNSILT